MKKISFGVFAVLMLASCGGTGSLGGIMGTKMDTEETYAKAKEIVANSFKVDEFKVIKVSISEKDKLENDLGYLSFDIVNPSGSLYYQNFIYLHYYAPGEFKSPLISHY